MSQRKLRRTPTVLDFILWYGAIIAHIAKTRINALSSVLFDGLIIIAGVLSIGAIIFLVYLFSIYAMSASGIFR
jgi:hypothetical protein